MGLFDKKYFNCNIYEYKKNSFIKLYEYNSPEFKALVAVDSLTGEKTAGGTRFINGESRANALQTVILLATTMSKKYKVSNGSFRGGKAFIYYTTLNRETMLELYAEVLNHIGGDYYACDDMNTSVHDLYYMRRFTPFVVGLLYNNIQLPATAYGVYVAIKSAVKYIMNRNLKEVKVAVQGIGKVGYDLCKFLYKDGAKIYVQEVDESKLLKLKQEIKFEVIPCDEDVTCLDVDVLSLCAFGGGININNVHTIKAKIICGGANNQLMDEELDDILYQRNVFFIPDFLANCGGVIDLTIPEDEYTPENVFKAIEIIGSQVECFIKESQVKRVKISTCVYDYINDKEV